MGAVATASEWLFYLCDDHRVHPDFSKDLAAFMLEHNPSQRDVIVPARFCERKGEKIGLNMGYPGYLGRAYCGGHGGIFPRKAIQEVPWSVAPWDRQWDFYHSRMLQDHDFRFHYMSGEMYIEDIEPNSEPWL